MNGDSFCDTDFKRLLDFHVDEKAVMTMVLAQSSWAKDCGFIKLNDAYAIVGLKGKISQSDVTLVNAEIYLMQKEVFSMMPAEKALPP